LTEALANLKRERIALGDLLRELHRLLLERRARHHAID